MRSPQSTHWQDRARVSLGTLGCYSYGYSLVCISGRESIVLKPIDYVIQVEMKELRMKKLRN